MPILNKTLLGNEVRMSFHICATNLFSLNTQIVVPNNSKPEVSVVGHKLLIGHHVTLE